MATAAAHTAVLPRAPRRLQSFFHYYPRAAAVAASIFGLIVLLGGLLNIVAITRLSAPSPVTVPNSAFMGVLAGVSLFLLASAQWGRGARVAGRTVAAILALMLLATLVEYVTGVDLGLDHWLADVEHAPWPVGRPSPYTVAAYLLVSSALLLGERKSRRGRYFADYLAVAAAAFAMAALLGFLFGVEAHVVPYVGMSPTTVLISLAVSIGILGLHVEDGLISIVLAPDAGGVVARRLLVGLVLFPPVAAILILGARFQLYALPLAAALTLLFALAESSVFILNTARRLSMIDAVQRELTEDLQRSEARVRLLVEEAKDGIFLADLDGKYIEVNPAACELSGYTREQLLGMTIADLAAPEERSKLAEERANIIAGKTSRREWRLRRADGSMIEVEVVANVLPDRRWQAFVRDITERKRHARLLADALAAERALRADLEAVDRAREVVTEAAAELRGADIDPVLAQIAEQARALTNATYAAVGIGGDESRPFEHWATSGMSAETQAAIGRPPRSVGMLAHASRSLEPLRVREITEHPAFIGLPPNHPELHSFLAVSIRQRGEVVGNIFLANKRDSAEFTDRDERLAGLLADGVALVIETARSYAWLQSIVDQLPDGVMIVGEHRQVFAINRAMRGMARDPGVTNGDAFANPALFEACTATGELIPHEDLPLPRVLRTGETVTNEELCLRQPDGTLLPVEARAVPLRGERGRPADAVAVVHNIAERKETERLREEWIALVAHDLRQPVQAIMLSFDMLFEHANEQDRALLMRVRTAAYHLNRLVGDLLDAARITAGRLAVECTYGNITTIVKEAIDLCHLTNRDIDIVLDAPPEQLAWVDPERIQQVLGNLLSNAAKYRTPDTPVRVHVHVPEPKTVLVCVCNEGPPLDPDDLAGLFGRFARTRTARGKHGIGLGLYISKGLVEAHGGRIWAESSGGVTKFYFTLQVPEIPPPRVVPKRSRPPAS
ncbi:MAG TPA: PAS domain S-box protein [Kofleriaceae bacterium]|nr:PAS domain S-box protein [Kofleriaceae bacterium]